MGLLSIIGAGITSLGEYVLESAGDYAEARITESNRKVLKISKDHGDIKYSATQYPNGTIVETRTTRNK